VEIVTDASAIIAVLLNEVQKDRLIECAIGADLIAPPSIVWEIGNAFSAMLRRERINLEQALSAIEVFSNIPIRYVDIDMDTSLKIAASFKTYAYDAYLLQCSLKYRSPLLTLDKNLIGVAKKMGISVIEV
jgi:predicted nucleic acid-binding protein